MTIEYGSVWQAREPPLHDICVFMKYSYYDVPKYFTLAVGGHTSKLLSEDFILKHYKLKEKK